MKVLLIDDDYEMVKWALNEISAKFVFAKNEKRAHSLLAKSSVDIILMDGHLGRGKYGFEYGHEVVARMRAKGIMTKIVMFSSEEKQNDLGIMAGANAILSKKDFLMWVRKYDDYGERVLAFFENILSQC